jgi:hypothetical protein
MALNYKRNNMLQALCIKWIRTQRPDILALIRAEVDKAYPLSTKRHRNSILLPASLQKAK